MAVSDDTQTVSLGTATGAPATSAPNCGGKGYVAVDSRGNIQQSDDLVHWTIRKSLAFTTLTGRVIVFAQDKYVVVSQISSSQSAVSTSPDGVTWTDVATVPFINAHIVWDGSEFVIVSRSNLGRPPIGTSPDAVTWTVRTSPFLTASSVATGAGLHVIGVLSGFRGTSGTLPKSIWTSPDWTTWTYRPSPWDTDAVYGDANDSEVWDLAWSGSLFVVVGQAYWTTGLGTVLYHSVMTSPNGIAWTARPSPFDQPLHPTTSGNARAVNWNGAWWTMVGAGPEGFIGGDIDFGGPFIATSTDGISWGRRRVANPAVDPSGPSWDQGWCVDGALGTTIAGGDARTPSDSPVAYSHDGTSWTVPETDLAEQDPSLPAFNGIALGAGGCGCSNARQRVDSRVIGTRVVARGAS